MRNKLNKEKLKGIYRDYDCNHIDRITSVLGMYRQGEYIYPDVIQRNLKVTKEEAFEVLKMLFDAGLAEVCFQYYCSNCQRAVGPFMAEDSHDEIYCPGCDSHVNKELKRYAYRCL